ncbi:MAG: ABC transporter ATP-binding protein [Bryobacterales bacterium]|nr:ABC transporter ATP-binding protein [Bryobacterales bacterium]
MSFAVSTHELSKRFTRVEALSGLTLDVPRGAIYALLGPNGAGKTTTLQILMDLARPSSGSATVLGVDSRKLDAGDRERIGYVSENQELPLWMTLDELIAFCRPLYPAWDPSLADHLADMLELPRRRKLRAFSRGMKRKAALVVSLAYRPPLLLLDEPFSGLDPLVRDQMLEALVEIAAQEGTTTLLSSHDIAEIENVADHVGFLRQGRLRVSEPLDALHGRFREVEALLPQDATPAVSPPPHWRDVERSGAVLRFLDSRYEPGASEAAWERALPPGTSTTASPVTLRRIFLALAREEEA